MKDMYGSPGKVSGLMLRIGQCFFSAASIFLMASSSGFSSSTAFCFLIASMGIQFLWCFALVCLDIHALRLNIDLQYHILVSLFVVGDWVTSILSLAAASSSAGVMILYARDTNLCKVALYLCSHFQISIAFAFISWFLLAISAHTMLWLFATV